MKKKDKKNKKPYEPAESVHDVHEQASAIMKSRDVAELDQVQIPEELRHKLESAGDGDLDELEREFGMDRIDMEEVERAKDILEANPPQSDAEPEEPPGPPSVDGTCSVRVSEDAMSAFISLHPSRHGGTPLTFEMVRKEIASAGVAHGVNEDLLKKLIMTVEKTGEEKQEVIFAKGTPPVEGRDGRIEYHFHDDESVLDPDVVEGDRR